MDTPIEDVQGPLSDLVVGPLWPGRITYLDLLSDRPDTCVAPRGEAEIKRKNIDLLGSVLINWSVGRA